jgi:hypothetical protein
MEPWEYCILVARTAAISAILLRSDESLDTLVLVGVAIENRSFATKNTH